MTESTAPIEDRAANIRLTVEHIISARTDQMFEDFDRLHRRNIHDDDVVEALRALGHKELREAYAEWAEIDIREDDNTTLNPVVPDPGNAPSYAELFAADGINANNLEQALVDVATEAREQSEIREGADLSGKWTNGLAVIEVRKLHIDRALIGAVWEAVQPDAVFGGRNLAVTPAGLRAAGYKRVQA